MSRPFRDRILGAPIVFDVRQCFKGSQPIDFYLKVKKYWWKVSTSGKRVECSRVTMIRRSFLRCIVLRSSIKYEGATNTTLHTTNPTRDLLGNWLQTSFCEVGSRSPPSRFSRFQKLSITYHRQKHYCAHKILQSRWLKAVVDKT